MPEEPQPKFPPNVRRFMRLLVERLQERARAAELAAQAEAAAPAETLAAD